ncbi:MAG: hypothetical protein V3T77_04900, partial [Planctomycetota bacterium]
QGNIEARPALVRGGVVFSNRKGLFYLPFTAGLEPTEIATFSAEDGIEKDWRRGRVRILDGQVTVFPDCILVSSSYYVRCYRKLPPPPKLKESRQ